MAAGLISFLSPCVLPLVPAYLGQLTAVAVAANGTIDRPSRWAAVQHAVAFVAGFGTVFTLLGHHGRLRRRRHRRLHAAPARHRRRRSS